MNFVHLGDNIGTMLQGQSEVSLAKGSSQVIRKRASYNWQSFSLDITYLRDSWEC